MGCIELLGLRLTLFLVYIPSMWVEIGLHIEFQLPSWPGSRIVSLNNALLGKRKTHSVS